MGKHGLVSRHERQQSTPQRRMLTFGRYPVIDKMPVTETLQEPGIAELLQVLRNTRLTLREDAGELRNAALAMRAQRHEA